MHTETDLSMSSRETQECIRLCQECQDACLSAVKHCLDKGDVHAMPEHIRLLRECAEMCATTVATMRTGSASHWEQYAKCADACESCAASCQAFAADDEVMRTCADLAGRCAISCRKMAQARL